MTAERLLYRVLSWLSPSFPVGGYSYSHGIETAVELGLVTDAQNLADWIDTILRYGAGRIDAGLFRFAWEAVIDEDEEAFARIAERADALMGTSELALESRNQGLAFISTVRAAWLQARASSLDIGAQDNRPATAIRRCRGDGHCRRPRAVAIRADGLRSCFCRQSCFSRCSAHTSRANRRPTSRGHP